MKNQTKGILLVVIPLPLLIFTLAAYAISSFVISSIAASDPTSDLSTVTTVGSIISVLLGAMGIFSLLGILVGFPLGIYYLTRPSEQNDKKSELT